MAARAYKWSKDYNRLMRLLKEGVVVVIRVEDEIGQAVKEGD